MSDIDWDEAPEGATHYMPKYNEFSEVWIKDISDDTYKYIRVDGTDGKDWQPTEPITRNELHGIIERPKPVTLSPIYTQTMKDNGDLPLVGMEFISTEFSQNRHSIVKAITNEYIIYICADPKHTSECCMEICANNFKPVTPPIALVDGKAYQFECGSNTRLGFFNGKGFLGGSHSYWDLPSCTNIQLLEVK